MVNEKNKVSWLFVFLGLFVYFTSTTTRTIAHLVHKYSSGTVASIVLGVQIGTRFHELHNRLDVWKSIW